MRKSAFDKESPNIKIDDALEALMKKIKDEPTDMAVKVVNAAISWEKVKHAIENKDEDFDVDE